MFYGALIVAGVQYSEQDVGCMVSAESLQVRSAREEAALYTLRHSQRTNEYSKDAKMSVECSEGGRAK